MIVVERTVGTWGVVKFKGEHKMSRFNIKFFQMYLRSSNNGGRCRDSVLAQQRGRYL